MIDVHWWSSKPTKHTTPPTHPWVPHHFFKPTFQVPFLHIVPSGGLQSSLTHTLSPVQPRFVEQFSKYIPHNLRQFALHELKDLICNPFAHNPLPFCAHNGQKRGFSAWQWSDFNLYHMLLSKAAYTTGGKNVHSVIDAVHLPHQSKHHRCRDHAWDCWWRWQLQQPSGKVVRPQFHSHQTNEQWICTSL